MLSLLTRHPGPKQGHDHRLPSLLIPMQHLWTVTGTAAVAVALRVALPVLTVATVVVHSEGVGGLEVAGGAWTLTGWRTCRSRRRRTDGVLNGS